MTWQFFSQDYTLKKTLNTYAPGDEFKRSLFITGNNTVKLIRATSDNTVAYFSIIRYALLGGKRLCALLGGYSARMPWMPLQDPASPVSPL